MDEKKTITFVGGPLDGQTKEVEKGQTIYVIKEQFDQVDIDIETDLTTSHLPYYNEVTYEELLEGSGVFILKE